MRVSKRYSDESFPRELFGLSRKQLDLLIQRSAPELVVRLLHLDVWGRASAYVGNRWKGRSRNSAITFVYFRIRTKAGQRAETLRNVVTNLP